MPLPPNTAASNPCNAVLRSIFYCRGNFPNINWEDNDTLLLLTSILFDHYFGVIWDLPRGYLIPRLPSRMNFLLAARDLYTQLLGTGPKSCFEM
jgi:23S rRNA A1618 N6-methylase RlmF